MAKFKLIAKAPINRNGYKLEKGTVVEITTKNATTPFYNGCVEIKKALKDQFPDFDYDKAKCSANDFETTKTSD